VTVLGLAANPHLRKAAVTGRIQYVGLELSDANRLKALADENTKLNRLLAYAMLDNAMLKEIAAKRC